MEAESLFSGAVRALQDGEVESAVATLKSARAQAQAAHEFDTTALGTIALIGLARIARDGRTFETETKGLARAGRANPGTAVERAAALVKARMTADKGEAGAAIGLLRPILLPDPGTSPEAAPAEAAESLVETARRRAANAAWQAELGRAVLAMAPAQTADVLESLLSRPGAPTAARRAVEARRAGRPDRAVWLFLAAGIETLRAGDLAQAIRHLRDGRDASVRVPDPVAYAFASLVLVGLFAATGDTADAVRTALRAIASLEEIVGAEGIAHFKGVLDAWRAAVGEDEFRRFMKEYTASAADPES